MDKSFSFPLVKPALPGGITLAAGIQGAGAELAIVDLDQSGKQVEER